MLPQLSRLAVMGDQGYVIHDIAMPPLEQTAARLGIQLLELDVRTVEDVDVAFENAKAWSAEALLFGVTPPSTARVLPRVAELAAQERLPALYLAGSDLAMAVHGLMTFGPKAFSNYPQGAEYVDKILRGASPADLPVEEPREWEFLVNVKAAQELGITFPPDAAAQVTRWVQ